MPYFQETRLEQSDLVRNALLASRYKAPLGLVRQPSVAERVEDNEDTGFSEISLNGAPRQCLQWLAPVLRDLSETRTPRWLTLIDPPAEPEPWMAACSRTGSKSDTDSASKTRHGLPDVLLRDSCIG